MIYFSSFMFYFTYFLLNFTYSFIHLFFQALLEDFRPNVTYADRISAQITVLTRELTSSVLKTFSLPHKTMRQAGSHSSSEITGRRLQTVPFTSVLARDQYVRTKHEYRSSWKSFGGRVLTLKTARGRVSKTILCQFLYFIC